MGGSQNDFFVLVLAVDTVFLFYVIPSEVEESQPLFHYPLPQKNHGRQTVVFSALFSLNNAVIGDKIYFAVSFSLFC